MASFIICGTASGEQQRPHVCQSQWGYMENCCLQRHNAALCAAPLRLHISHLIPQLVAILGGVLKILPTCIYPVLKPKYLPNISPERGKQSSSNVSSMGKTGTNIFNIVLVFLILHT